MDTDLAYLSNKRVLLDAPGFKKSDLYSSIMNSSVELVEATYNTGRLKISATSKGFGGTSQFIIPNSSFIGTTYLHLELPNLLDGQTLSRGWGYAAIRSMSYLFGSSNVSQIQLGGQAHFLRLMSQCETAEKRSELFRLGGDEYLSPITFLDPADNVVKRDPNAVISADIILGLPWSSPAGDHMKLPFDTNILSNPITIQIEWAQARELYGGNVTISPVPPPPTEFAAAVMSFHLGDLTNKDQSLRRELEVARNSNEPLYYSYPFIHSQSYTPTQFWGSTSSASPVSVPLLGFINADLLSIDVGIVRTNLLQAGATSSPNVFQYDNIQNVALKFNGLIMFEAPKNAWRLIAMRGTTGAAYFQNSLILPHTADPASFDSIPQDTYILQIDFTRIRSMLSEGEMQNVWRIGNNALTLEFTTEAGADVRYQMFCVYHYNAIGRIDGGGMTEVYFN